MLQSSSRRELGLLQEEPGRPVRPRTPSPSLQGHVGSSPAVQSTSLHAHPLRAAVSCLMTSKDDFGDTCFYSEHLTRIVSMSVSQFASGCPGIVSRKSWPRCYFSNPAAASGTLQGAWAVHIPSKIIHNRYVS